MTEAIFGLVGVVVGGVVAGGATYLMALRTERQHRRSAARLVEAELRYLSVMVQRALGFLGPEVHVAFRNTSEVGRNLSSISAPVAWHRHKDVLSEVLSARDWYALADAYETIETLRVIDLQTLFTADGQPFHTVIGEILAEYPRDIEQGIGTLAEMTGADPERDERRATREPAFLPRGSTS